MRSRKKINPLRFSFLRLIRLKKGKKGKLPLSIDKRQKFVIATVILSLTLFISEFQFSNSGFYIVFLLAVITNFFLWWAIYADLRENKSYQIFILPFFYNIAFGMFYFLTPAIFLSRVVLTIVYALGIYSLLLSQNILIVASTKTIALLSGARIVSLVITLISYFFLTNIVFTLHANIFIVGLLVFLYSYALIYGSLWTYNLQNTIQDVGKWGLAATVCLTETATILWFWPSSPTVIALFLAGFFYTIVGLSHVWFERRLFKGILWEYVWVSCITFFLLILFTPWGK